MNWGADTIQSITPQVGSSLAVQWLGLLAFTAMGPGSISGWGTKTLQTGGRGQ